MGLYNYDNTVLEGLFEALPKPAYVPRITEVYDPIAIDKEAFLYALMLECGELEFIVPSLPLAKSFIRSWATTNRDVWQRLYNTLWYKYNPIWNKDGKYSHTESGENSDTITEKKDETKTGTGNKTSNIESAENVDSTSTNKVTGFNDDSFANNTQDIANSERTGSASETIQNSDSERLTGDNITVRNGTNGKTYTDIEQGNIGVTTTQQMIKEEREKALFNIYDFIIKSFRDRFCLTVY